MKQLFIPDDLYEKLKTIAKAKDKNPSQALEFLIVRFHKNLEYED